MSGEKIAELSSTKLNMLSCTPRFKEKIITLCKSYDVTGSSVENIVNVIQAVGTTDEKNIENAVRAVLESNSSLLYGHTKMRDPPKAEFDLSVLNSSVPAQEIVQMIQNAETYAQEHDAPLDGIRMLFYGASGTGKTELARYIAKKLGKRILLKRASDIVSKGVGDTEKNISAAFYEAESSGQILLFDKADSFFRSRAKAQYEWEITKTNEFLTQMEEFKGILICTTNMKDDMDPATLRRFHICAQFNALDRSGIDRLLKKYFSQFTFSKKQLAAISAYNSVTPGDFGTLASRIRFMQKDAVTADYIIKELIAQQKEKDNENNRRIGFNCE